MPLEEILNLTHPSIANPEPPVEDKRTWRVDRGDGNAVRALNSQTEPKEIKWTAMDIMTAYALQKGWLTAKAGRPDVNRAGNASKCCFNSVTDRIVETLYLFTSSSGCCGESRAMGFLATR